MFTNEELNEAIAIVKSVVDNGLFDKTKTEWSKDYPDLIEFGGATKIVLINKYNESYVIKVDEPNCVTKEAIGFNYCRNEYRNYLYAKDYGIAHLFAEIAPLITINEHEFYIQKFACPNEEYIECFSWDANGDYSYTDEDGILHYSGDEDDLVSLCDDFLWEHYSRNDMMKLHEMCEDLEINDIHTGNIGFTEDDILIIDYSGYVDCEYCYMENKDTWYDRIKWA